jgi:hypothetical protein
MFVVVAAPIGLRRPCIRSGVVRACLLNFSGNKHVTPIYTPGGQIGTGNTPSIGREQESSEYIIYI